MASPSRSKSVASQRPVGPLNALRSCATVSAFSSGTTYSGRKSCVDARRPCGPRAGRGRGPWLAVHANSPAPGTAPGSSPWSAIPRSRVVWPSSEFFRRGGSGGFPAITVRHAVNRAPQHFTESECSRPRPHLLPLVVSVGFREAWCSTSSPISSSSTDTKPCSCSWCSNPPASLSRPRSRCSSAGRSPTPPSSPPSRAPTST